MRSTLVKYVGLNIIGMIGLSCYILADTFFVAQALGTVGLAALNFSISVFSVLQGVGLMIGIGGATDFAVGKSAGREKTHCESFVHALCAGAVAAVFFLTIGLFFTAPLATLLGADAQTLPLTTTYLKTLLSFAPFFLLNNTVLAFVRNDQAPKLAMTAMLISSFSNIILDYVFMFPLGMGIFGAALATGLSPVISLCILALHWRGEKPGFGIGKCSIRIRRILRQWSLGFSSLVGELASAISLIVFNLVILGLAGNTGVAAYGIIANLALVATAVFVGIAQGIQPLASDGFGAGAAKTLRRLLADTLIIALGISLVLVSLVFFFAPDLVAVFNSEGNVKLAELAVQGMRIYFIGYLFAGVNIVAAAFLSAVCRARQAMGIAVLRSCLLLVPMVFACCALFGITGIWLAFVATEALVLVLTGVFLFRTAKKVC